MSTQLLKHTSDHRHADELLTALALLHYFSGDRFDSMSTTHAASVAPSSARRCVSIRNAVSVDCFNRRVARPTKRTPRKKDHLKTREEMIFDAAAIRRAAQQMARARDAVLRGDTYRVGGRHDAPTDRASDIERSQSREYIKRER